MAPTVQRHSSLFEAGLHKERPAEWNSSCQTNTHTHTNAMQKHTMENATESKTAGAKGFPMQCAKQINHTHTHTGVHKHLPADLSCGIEVPGFPTAPEPPTHCTHARTRAVVVTFSGSCWALPVPASWWWLANDIRLCTAISSGSHLRLVSKEGKKFIIVYSEYGCVSCIVKKPKQM